MSPVLFMKVRCDIAGKRVPREAYLACDDTDTLFSSRASRGRASYPRLQQKLHESCGLGRDRWTVRREKIRYSFDFSSIHFATPLAWSLIFSSMFATSSANCSGCGAVLGSKQPASRNICKYSNSMSHLLLLVLSSASA